MIISQYKITAYLHPLSLRINEAERLWGEVTDWGIERCKIIVLVSLLNKHFFQFTRLI